MNNNITLNIEQIIDEYSNYIYKIVDNIIGVSLPYQDKEEIVSDTFYLLWKNQNNINSDLKSYLSAIARNCSYNKLRKNKINYEYDEDILYTDFNQIDRILYIKEKLNSLDKEETELIIFHYVKGFKIKEIAKLTNKSSGSIKIKLYRLRKKLKEDLDSG